MKSLFHALVQNVWHLILDADDDGSTQSKACLGKISILLTFFCSRIIVKKISSDNKSQLRKVKL